MKILFVTTDFKPRSGGVAELGYRVCRELQQHGHDVQVLTQEWPGEPVEGEWNGVHVRRLIAAAPQGSNRVLGYIRRSLWSGRAIRTLLDVTQAYTPDLLFAGNYNALISAGFLRTGVPYVVFLHGEDVAATLATRAPGRKQRLQRVLAHAHWTFWNSSYSFSLTERLTGQPIPNGTPVGCGFPVEQIVEQRDRGAARVRLGWDESPVLLTIARLVLRKGIDTTLHALQRVHRKTPTCRYVIVGDGPARGELAALADNLRLADRVTFTGFVDEEVKRDIYQAADVYVMPSRPGDQGEVEGFGISFLEANACGLPVIGSTAGGIPDAVESGVNGLLVDPHDTDALANAINTLLRDPQRCQEMARAGQQRIRERFNWPRIVTEIEEQLSSVSVERVDD